MNSENIWHAQDVENIDFEFSRPPKGTIGIENFQAISPHILLDTVSLLRAKIVKNNPGVWVAPYNFGYKTFEDAQAEAKLWQEADPITFDGKNHFETRIDTYVPKDFYSLKKVTKTFVLIVRYPTNFAE